MMKGSKTAFCVILCTCMLLSGCGKSGDYTDGFEAGYQAGYEAGYEAAANGSAPSPEQQGNKDNTPEADAPAPAEPTPAEPVTVSYPVDYSSWPTVPANALPDLHYWSGRKIGYADEPLFNGSTAQYMEYGCKNAENQAIFEAYLESLQNHGYTLVGHYNKYGSESWGLICDAAPEATTIGQMYTDTPCHVTVYDDDGIMEFVVSTDLVVCDTGLRSDGYTGDLTPQGPSAAAGLIRLPDGSYQTSDGRLTAAVGTAMVLRDGTAYTTSAEYAAGDTLNIDGYYRNESIFFRANAGYLMEGDVLTQREMRQWRQYSKEKGEQNLYKYDTIADLSVANDGEWISPAYSSLSSAEMDVCTVRVMYLDEGGDAVFYIYARFFEGEPREVEALCAVSTADDEGAFSNATYLNAGETTELNYSHREYGSNYHTFDWKIVEGSGTISIQSVGDSCTVTALKTGTAAVKVTYGYSVEEPDVLTGTPRDVSRSKTETWYFVVK